MSEISGAVPVHQALHGYGDGHQLIASSLDLSREQQWQMLVMSDLSGPSFRSGFDGYLTGYPLDGGGFYCLSKTWFAPELPRPGCVWTHTLLIRDPDVARIRDIRALLGHFRRPMPTHQIGYDVALDVGIADQLTTVALDVNVATGLITLLYGSPGMDVVLTSDSATTYEDALGVLFAQQWPRLRRRFRFCTGALSIRDVRFDLAVAPPNVVRRDVEKTRAFDAGALSALSAEARDEWVALAAGDLSGQEPSVFRKFLWAFGPDYADGRAVYRALAEIYVATAHEGQGIEEALSAVGHFFPDPESSRRLKASLFAAESVFSRSRGEAVILGGLVSHPAASSIPNDVAMVGDRAVALVVDDLQNAVKIAMTSAEVGGPRAQEYLDGFMRGVLGAHDAIADVPTELLLRLVRREPNLLTRADVWRALRNQQQHLAGMLWSLSRNEAYVIGVVSAVLEAQAWDALTGSLACYGVSGVSAVLRWIDSRDGPLSVPSSVIRALRDCRSDLAGALAAGLVRSKAVLVAAATLDPRSHEVRDVPIDVWATAAARGLRFDDAHIDLRSKAFLLSVGLSSDAPTAVALVREAFSDVYEGAKEGGGIDHSLWGFIEPYLPWSHMTWDRCKRLIRGVVRQFVDRQWPQQEFLQTFQSAEQLERALGEADRTFKGSRYARSVCESASQLLASDDPRVRVIADFCGSDENTMPEF